jgi:SAM-dependent methyltransferase
MTADHVRRNRAVWNADSDCYQVRNGAHLDREPRSWGVWQIPESEVRALGDVAGRRVLELGCGAAQWGCALAADGARIVGIDLSDRQLAHARERRARLRVRLPLVQGSAERLPFRDDSFDLVFCDHGATSFTDPRVTLPEAARVLVPGGDLVFNITSPLHDLCFDAERDAATDRLVTDYFTLDRFEDGAVSFQRTFGDWLRAFAAAGLEVLELIEPRPPAGATTTYASYSAEWARRWPAECLWRLRRR